MASGTPAQVGARFQRRIRDLLRDYDELVIAVHEKRRQASLETMLAEQTVMALATFWEAFLHEIFVALVVRRSASCVSEYRRRIIQSMEEKFVGAVQWLTILPPQRLNHAQVEKLLDPKGRNVVATSSATLANLANTYLDATDAQKFALNADDAAFVDYLVACRNYLGHRSTAARQAFLNAMAKINRGASNGDLVGPARRFGAYLKANVGHAGERRVKIIGRRTIEIAAKLSHEPTRR